VLCRSVVCKSVERHARGLRGRGRRRAAVTTTRYYYNYYYYYYTMYYYYTDLS